MKNFDKYLGEKLKNGEIKKKFDDHRQGMNEKVDDYLKEPNGVTKRVIDEVDSNKNLIYYSDIDELFRDLGI